MTITTLDNGLIIVPRADWGARYSAGGRELKRGITEVNIHHTVTDPQGDDDKAGFLDPSDDPCLDMRKLEAILQSRGLAPGYSWVVHPSGVLLEGAGNRAGAHTGGRNSVSYGISFMGNFEQDQPTLAALVAAGRLLNLLRLDDRLAELGNVTIQPHSATKATACCGHNLREALPWIRWFAGTNA